MNPNGQNGNQNTNPNPNNPGAPIFQAPQNNAYANPYQQPMPNQNYGPDTRMQSFINQAEYRSQGPMQPQMQAPVPPQTIPAPQSIQAPAQTTAPAKKTSHIGEIILIIFIFIIAGAAVGGAIYCYTQYDELNREVLADRSIKVDNAKAEQKTQDEQNYEIRTKKTTREFTGPSNFGALTFEYPKDWNVYIANDSSTEPSFTAYFGPDYVKPLNSDNQGLVFKINSSNYDSQIKQYENNLISSQAHSQNGLTGSIFTGKLDKKADSKTGKAVVLQINNYSATIMTPDYDTYGVQFDMIISTLRSANYK